MKSNIYYECKDIVAMPLLLLLVAMNERNIGAKTYKLYPPCMYRLLIYVCVLYIIAHAIVINMSCQIVRNSMLICMERDVRENSDIEPFQERQVTSSVLHQVQVIDCVPITHH